MARFSNRTGWDASESDLARMVRERRQAGEPVIDLTLSNPTLCGFLFDEAGIFEPLRDPAALVYDPDARGLPLARAAVARYYADHHAAIDPDQIVLTTSTSEAYSFLFRLLCDSGDEILAAQPGYPLFDFLATLDEIVLRTYPLFYDFGWWIDLAELERRITPRTRALVVVHPNNPTGHATGTRERLQLEEICTRHGLALIVDEVFLDYQVADSAAIESFARGPHPCLTLVVSGLSKICALPQMKAGWIAVFGPAGERATALNRLEIIADTFLSMNAPIQHALPAWLGSRGAILNQIRARVQQNLALLAGFAPDGLLCFPVEAGWSAIVRLPSTLDRPDGTGLAEWLLECAGVLVHPGSFYGLEGGNLAVISLIGPPASFRQGLERLGQLVEDR